MNCEELLGAAPAALYAFPFFLGFAGFLNIEHGGYLIINITFLMLGIIFAISSTRAFYLYFVLYLHNHHTNIKWRHVLGLVSGLLVPLPLSHFYISFRYIPGL